MIKGLLFDKDGTLFDFNASWGRCSKAFIDELSTTNKGREQLAAEMRFDYQKLRFFPESPIIAGTADEIFAAILRAQPERKLDEIEEIVFRHINAAQMVPACDFDEFFAAIDGLSLGVATNDNEAAARAHLRFAGIEEQFDFIAGADSGFGAKPDAGMCRAFLQHAEISGEEGIMIGDSVFDMLAGKSAGMRTIGVLTGPADANELALADDILPSIAALPRWLQENC